MLKLLKSFLGQPATRKAAPVARQNRLGMTVLEDRCTPASLAGNIITLDVIGEMLTIATFNNGQVSVASTGGINGGTANSTVTFAPNGPVSIVDTAAGTTVLFGDSSVAFTQALSVTLDSASNGVRFLGKNDFGSNALSVTTDRGIAVNSGAQVTAGTSGPNSAGLTFSANQQDVATVGNFIGIDVQGFIGSSSGTITLNGRGGTGTANGLHGVQVIGSGSGVANNGFQIFVNGTGGAGTGANNVGVHVALGGIISGGTVTGFGGAGTGAGQFGVLVQNAGSYIGRSAGSAIVNGTAGANSTGSAGVGVYVNAGGLIGVPVDRFTQSSTITVTGTGAGAGASGSNIGVLVAGTTSSIQSYGGELKVTGTGGGGTNGGNIGVFVLGGQLIGGNGGSATIIGTGGSGGTDGNSGVLVQSSADGKYDASITSSGSNLSVTGTGGGTGGTTDRNNIGVYAYGSYITGGFNTKLTISGTGGPGTNSTDLSNYGIFNRRSGFRTFQADMIITATTPRSYGLFSDQATYSVTEFGSMAFNMDSYYATAIDNITNNGGTGSVSFTQITPSVQIGFSGVSRPAAIATMAQPAKLVVSPDYANVNKVFVGRTDGGTITVDRALGRPNPYNLTLRTGADLITPQNVSVGTGNLTLTVGGAIQGGTPASGNAATDFTANVVSISSGTTIRAVINGTTADTSYTRFVGNAFIDLTGLKLAFSGSYTPVTGDVFTIVSASNIGGTFDGIANNGTVTFNGKTLRINYTATAVTATTL
jgi:hypothetical protein